MEDFICLSCKHYRTHTSEQEAEIEKEGIIFSPGESYCKAFPYGIPEGLKTHNAPKKGQSGNYMFEKSDYIHLREG